VALGELTVFASKFKAYEVVVVASTFNYEEAI
jgi:hypothetical protein